MGPPEKIEKLSELIEQNLSVDEIAQALDIHPRTAGRWLIEYGLATRDDVRRRRRDARLRQRRMGVCRRHGPTEMVARLEGGWRCVKCRSAAVSEARRRRKLALIAEAGGRCVICGYDRCAAALEFHHVDPTTKRFSMANGGFGRSLERMREELAKCVLLCANCHAEVGRGVSEVPIQ